MNGIHSFFLRLFLSCLFFCSVAVSGAYAEVAFDPIAGTKFKSCDDYATLELNNPWDMSDQADINNFFKHIDVLDFENAGISGGIFSGKALGANSTLYLFSPVPCGAYPVAGRYGQNLSLDTSKYKRLSIRMYTDTPDPSGISLIWDRDCNYANVRSVTLNGVVPTKAGWHTYTFDLPNIPLLNSADTRVWTNGPITGLAIKPTTKANSQIKIDWVRLEDPSPESCELEAGSGANNFDITPNAEGNKGLYSLYLVPDGRSSPFSNESTRGFEGEAIKVAQAANGSITSVSITDPVGGTAKGIEPGTYRLMGIIDSDYATLETNNPWDFNDKTDLIQIESGIQNASFQNGIFSGNATGGSRRVFFQLGSAGINTAKYTKLTVKGSFSGDPNIYPSGSAVSNLVGDIRTLDLTGAPGWSGTTTTFSLEIPVGAFSIDFVSLRADGFDTSRDSMVLSDFIIDTSDPFVINRPPIFAVEKPSTKGGEALKAWNMNQGDFSVLAELRSGVDASRPSEPYTAFLPDVRLVDGVRGDFFKGTSINGNNDPTNYSTFIHSRVNNFYFSADEYRHLCFKLNIERDFDLGEGSVARVLWKGINRGFSTGDDLVLIYNNWSGSRWNEYCMDMVNMQLEGGIPGDWTGMMEAFRVDPHEFSVQTSYYFDWIKLRKDTVAPGRYNISYSFSDPDADTPVTLNFYYSTSKNTFNPANLIATKLSSDASRVIDWNTQAVPAGVYYIHATADDGINPEVKRYSAARLVVSAPGNQGSAPALSVEAPQNGVAVCDFMQVKGFALQPDRLEDVSVVEVQVDGTYFASIYPSEYSGAAKQSYPTADSSNAGFNKLFDASSLTNGNHTVTIAAYSSRGPLAVQHRTINKQNAGCPNPIVDPDPSGSAVDAGTPPPTATPTPKPAPPTSPVKIKSATLTASGVANVVVSGLSSKISGCQVLLLGRAKSKDKAASLVKTTITAADVKQKQIIFRRSKLYVSKKGPASVQVSAQLTCKSTKYAESGQRKYALIRKKTSGLKSAKEVLASLKRLAKVAPPKAKKKR